MKVLNPKLIGYVILTIKDRPKYGDVLPNGDGIDTDEGFGIRPVDGN